jgi:bla regulator protein BlaR1
LTALKKNKKTAAMEINNALIRSLGMALVHSLWEGLVILVLVLFALSLASRSNARLRYGLFVSGHLLLLAVFISTWYIMYHHNMASALKPFTRVYSQVYGLVRTSSIALPAADLTTPLKQFLEPVYPSLAVGWIMGFLFMVIRMAGGFYLSYNIMKKDIFLPDPSLLAVFEKLKRKLTMPASLRLRMSARQISPMVIGIFKPCIIVPAAILSGLNPEQVEAILVHELAHIRRYDHVIMIIQTLVSQVLFFHPAAWFFSAGINRERENCCDDFVMKTFPNPINYIKALTMIQELNTDGQVPANALLGRSKRLLGRVKRLLKTEKRHAPVFRMAVIFLLFVTLGIAAITIASAGNPITKKGLEKFFTVKPGRMPIAADTTKFRKHEKATVDKEAGITDDGKKQKEMIEASRKLEKAQLEMQKARLELEKAREEFMRAGGKMSHDMAELSDEQAEYFMTVDQMREFKLKHEQEFDEMRRAMDMQRHAMEDDFRRSQDDMKRSLDDLHMSEEDMRFEKMRHVNKPPAPPLPPAHVDVPDSPSIENPAPPEPVEHMQLMNDDKGSGNKESSDQLDSKLKEVEKE